MSELIVKGLRASVARGLPGTTDGEILQGIDIAVKSGEVHAVMGPNGSGKSTLSHVLMGRPGYRVTGGSVTLDGVDLLGMRPADRAREGLFLAMQYPTEVPGVALEEMLIEALRGRDGIPTDSELHESIKAEAERIGFDERFLSRPLNVDLSGGEKKRNETLQLSVLKPKIAVLDEIDSGLDIDALRAVSRRVEDATNERGLGVLAITHYTRLLTELKPDFVHILVKGAIVKSGGPELADELEADGYAAFVGTGEASSAAADPFGDPLA